MDLLFVAGMVAKTYFIQGFVFTYRIECIYVLKDIHGRFIAYLHALLLSVVTLQLVFVRMYLPPSKFQVLKSYSNFYPPKIKKLERPCLYDIQITPPK